MRFGRLGLIGSHVVIAIVITTVAENVIAQNSVADESVASDASNFLPTLVRKLDHDDYRTREAAREAILQWAVNGSEEQWLEMCSHGRGLSAEARLALVEIVQRSKLVQFDRQMELFSRKDVDAEQLRSRGWEQWAHAVGDDMAARRVFAKLCERHPRCFDDLSDCQTQQALDPYRLDRDDRLSWMMLLSRQFCSSVPRQSSAKFIASRTRISMALSNPSLGPRLSMDVSNDEAIVLSRLVTTWLAQSQHFLDARTHLRIAMRYRCQQHAEALCQQILAEPESPPASVVTALLFARKHQYSELIDSFADRLSDQRTAHVWQTIEPRGMKIRTQVRDVAMVLMLDGNGIDAREVGFEHLQADPLTVFLDHSLGFETNVQREAAFEAAEKRMSRVGVEH